MRNWFVLGSMLLAAACGSSNSGGGGSTTCGAGTVLSGTTCVPDGSGSGNNTTCGTGTHLDGTMCVPDGSTPGTPSIMMISPNEWGVTGGTVFQIVGTSLAGSDPTQVHVYFGDTTAGTGGNLGPCEALVASADDTTIAGEIPFACDLNVTVTVQTDKGTATVPFHYDAVFLADGYDYDFQQDGALWVMDPVNGMVWSAGALADAANGTYQLEGLAFSPTGTLFGVTTGASQGDGTTGPQLVTIDTSTFAVTPVGALTDGTANLYYLTDIKFSGTTLYGWGIQSTDGGTSYANQLLVTIDTDIAGGTAGTITPATSTSANNYGIGGLAVVGTSAYVAPSGAATDAAVGATGELDTVDLASGGLTPAGTLDYQMGAPIEAMSTMTFGGTAYLIAAISDGEYGAYFANQPTHGVTFAIIDPAASQGQYVYSQFEMPALPGEQSHISAMEAAPATGVSIAAQLKRAKGHFTKMAGSAHSLQR